MTSSPTAFGYEAVADGARQMAWEHPRTGHVVVARHRGTNDWRVSEVRPGRNDGDVLRAGLTGSEAVDHAGRVARAAEPGGTPGDFDIGGGL